MDHNRIGAYYAEMAYETFAAELVRERQRRRWMAGLQDGWDRVIQGEQQHILNATAQTRQQTLTVNTPTTHQETLTRKGTYPGLSQMNREAEAEQEQRERATQLGGIMPPVERSQYFAIRQDSGDPNKVWKEPIRVIIIEQVRLELIEQKAYEDRVMSTLPEFFSRTEDRIHLEREFEKTPIEITKKEQKRFKVASQYYKMHCIGGQARDSVMSNIGSED